MPFSFVKVIDRYNQPPEWLLRIVSPEELAAYAFAQSEVKAGLKDYIVSQGGFGRHTSTPLSSALELTARCGVFAPGPHPLVRLANTAAALFLTSKMELVRAGRAILINPLGGFRPLDAEDRVLDLIRREDLRFPVEGESAIRILSWRGGRHFYAKVGNEDVIIDDAQKWDSGAEARAAAVRYIEENAITLEGAR